jgi:multidrug efflux pump subunit AcrA (membrane-fusion protein)
MVFVVVRKPNGMTVAVPRPVTLGEAVGSRFVVLRGLKPGELVIVRGNERVRPGMPVRPLRRPS